MTVREFLKMTTERAELVTIFDYNSDYDYVNEFETDGMGGFVYEGWSDEIKKFTDPEIVERWLNSDIESWEYAKTENFGNERVICLNISSDC